MTPSTNTLEATVPGRVARWALSAALAAVVAGVLWAGLVSSAMAGETCANAAVRVQTGSTALPDCRAYEMVSAPYKEGFGILPGAPVEFTEDGIVSYQSHGALAGNVGGSVNNLYHAFRSAAGWPTSSLDPPATIYESYGRLQAESDDLRWSLWNMFRRSDESAADLGFWRRSPDNTFTRMGDGTSVVLLSSSFLPGVSVADLSHIVVAPGLSEYVGTGNDGSPRPVAVMNNGQPTAGIACLNSVSSDGRVLVFGSDCITGTSFQLWARVDGSATVAVSASECTREADDDGGLCNGVSAATYVGGAVDGSRVFFTTRQQLVNGDTDTDNGDLFAGNDLYACDIPAGTPLPVGPANSCESPLTKVSRTVSGAANDARVENVVSVSEDGSRVYFVARGVLADNLDVGGVGASAGAENLYLWERGSGDPAGQTRYVARLASNDVTRGQMTPDGRYLLFVTANVLAGGDADDGAKDVYRYDASTHTIVRLSTSVAGGGGNGPGFDVSIPGKSAMSADGSTVIFDTAEALSPMDANGVGDVYSWRDGKVSLISADGGSTVGVTPSGRDLFFLTSAQVLGADRDINTDIYDARLGGGFAPTETPMPCFGDQCQGERSQAPSLAGPLAVGSGDGLSELAPMFSVRAVSATQRRALAATGKISLTVTANTAGTISARVTATIAGRSVAVGSGRQTLANAGTVAVALTLSKKARGQLASRGRLTIKVAVSHSVVALDRSVTLKLVHAKAKAKRAVKRSARPVTHVGGGQS